MIRLTRELCEQALMGGLLLGGGGGGTLTARRALRPIRDMSTSPPWAPPLQRTCT